MKPFYMGIDVSKGYADFMIINSKKQPVVQSFQLDDTFEGHRSFYNLLSRFLADYPESTLFAAVESTGGYENNWYNSLIEFQGSLNHAYPVTAQFAISLRGPRLRGRTGLCTISHRSVTLSGRQFSVHYQKPLMARNDD